MNLGTMQLADLSQQMQAALAKTSCRAIPPSRSIRRPASRSSCAATRPPPQITAFKMPTRNQVEQQLFERTDHACWRGATCATCGATPMSKPADAGAAPLPNAPILVTMGEPAASGRKSRVRAFRALGGRVRRPSVEAGWRSGRVPRLRRDCRRRADRDARGRQHRAVAGQARSRQRARGDRGHRDWRCDLCDERRRGGRGDRADPQGGDDRGRLRLSRPHRIPAAI